MLVRSDTVTSRARLLSCLRGLADLPMERPLHNHA